MTVRPAGFTLRLFDSRRHQSIKGVSSFVGMDESGSFGILPGHARMMTTLVFGLARMRIGSEGAWQYLAIPGAVLYFSDNELNLMCRHYLIDEDFERISNRLAAELVSEEEQLHEVRESLRRMEEAMLKRMWELGQQGVHL